MTDTNSWVHWYINIVFSEKIIFLPSSLLHRLPRTQARTDLFEYSPFYFVKVSVKRWNKRRLNAFKRAQLHLTHIRIICFLTCFFRAPVVSLMLVWPENFRGGTCSSSAVFIGVFPVHSFRINVPLKVCICIISEFPQNKFYTLMLKRSGTFLNTSYSRIYLHDWFWVFIVIVEVAIAGKLFLTRNQFKTGDGLLSHWQTRQCYILYTLLKTDRFMHFY